MMIDRVEHDLRHLCSGRVVEENEIARVAQGGKLAVVATPNQDSPISNGAMPLLGIDVWEHAYYLKYQNRRADYVKAFQEVIDWAFVGARYKTAAAR
jgi:superoxide dismutase